MIKAAFTTGAMRRIETEVEPIDLTQTDEAIFNEALHKMAVNWSSTGGVPHHKNAMARNGKVIRQDGKVHIQGAGWYVSITTPEFDAEIKRLVAEKDWVGLADITGKQTVTWSN